MKKIIALCLVLILVFTISFSTMSYADPMTLSQIASLTYGLGNSFGLDFAMSGITATGANDFFSSKINTWLSGRSISEVFGVTPAQIIAGKLVIPHLLYNGIREFLQSFVSDNNIDSQEKNIIYAVGNYEFFTSGYIYDDAGRVATTWYSINSITGVREDYHTGYFLNTPARIPVNQGLSYENNTVYGLFNQNGGGIQKLFLRTITSQSMSSIGVSIDGDIPETVLNPNEEWTGTIGGQDWPDTNLDQLLGQIDQDVADNNLDVEGEVTPVVPPTPAPTPAPIEPDTPLSDVPWEGLNDLLDLTGQGISDSVGTAANDITGAIDGLRDETAQGVQDITGAIEGVQEGVAGLTDTIEDALTAPEIDEKTFDLRELFPFCIPFDIYHLLKKFDSSPSAPHVQLPIVIPSIGFSYTMDLDFSAWDPVADAMRTVELIVYALGLAWATSKVIKW